MHFGGNMCMSVGEYMCCSTYMNGSIYMHVSLCVFECLSVCKYYIYKYISSITESRTVGHNPYILKQKKFCSYIILYFVMQLNQNEYGRQK